jgi:hypothetical protein
MLVRGAHGMPNVLAKHTFGATAGAGCALVTFQSRLLMVFPGGGGLGGAAPNYMLNIMPIDNPQNVDEASANKSLVVRPETTAHRPAAAVHKGTLFIAYTDRTPAGQIHLLAFTSITQPPTSIALPETAAGGPALASYNGNLVLAFAGGGGFGAAAPNTQLNVMWSPDGHTWSANNQFVSTHTSLFSPALAPMVDNGVDSILMLAFTGTNNQVYILKAPLMNFAQLNADPGQGLAMQVTNHSSDFGPGLASFNESNPTGAAGDGDNWTQTLIWAGAGDRQLNTMEAGANGTTLSFQKTLTETAGFEPATIQVQGTWYGAWAGTDAARRLNLAALT